MWGAGLCVVIIRSRGVQRQPRRGCDGDGGEPATATATTTVTAAVTTGRRVDHRGARTAATTTVSTAAAVPDLPPRCSELWNWLTTTYHFVSTVTLDGAVALVADGDRVGDGSRVTLTSNDGNASYVITADGSWVMLPGGDGRSSTMIRPTPIRSVRCGHRAVQAKASDGTDRAPVGQRWPRPRSGRGDAPVELDVAIPANVLSSVSYATVVATSPPQ